MCYKLTAKEYLLQIENLTNRIKEQEEYIQRLKDSLSIAGISYDKDRVQTSPDPDKFGHIFAQIDEQEKVLEDMKTKLVNVRVEALNIIHKIEDDRYRRILTTIYVDMRSLKKAANILSFSYDYMKELHQEALNAFSENFPP